MAYRADQSQPGKPPLQRLEDVHGKKQLAEAHLTGAGAPAEIVLKNGPGRPHWPRAKG